MSCELVNSWWVNETAIELKNSRRVNEVSMVQWRGSGEFD